MTMFSQARSALVGLVLGITAAMPASGTEPLHDQYTVGNLTGTIFPAKCCWLKLPPSERLREMKLSEAARCSALGGPVGMFEQRAGQLWLTALYKCGGEVALRDVYPDASGPMAATWLSGSFTAQVGYLCSRDARPVYALEQAFTVDQGVITAMKETRADPSVCPPTS